MSNSGNQPQNTPPPAPNDGDQQKTDNPRDDQSGQGAPSTEDTNDNPKIKNY